MEPALQSDGFVEFIDFPRMEVAVFARAKFFEAERADGYAQKAENFSIEHFHHSTDVAVAPFPIRGFRQMECFDT